MVVLMILKDNLYAGDINILNGALSVEVHRVKTADLMFIPRY